MIPNIYIERRIKNQYNKIKRVLYHGYLYGLISSFKFKKDREFHSMVLITGAVGAGKSSLVEGLAALDADLNGLRLTFDNIKWTTEPFIEQMERIDNIGSPLIFDESVMGITGKSIGNTKVGFKLKVGFITRRFKRHTYFLLVDEISEYSLKLIKMCDAWINVKTKGVKRGYFEVYTSNSKIEFLYRAFKEYKKTWNSKLVRSVKPDSAGTFQDFSGKFFNKKEYSERKHEETKQLTDGKAGQVVWSIPKVKAYTLWANGGLTQHQIATKVETPVTTVNAWVNRDFKKL